VRFLIIKTLGADISNGFLNKQETEGGRFFYETRKIEGKGKGAARGRSRRGGSAALWPARAVPWFDQFASSSGYALERFDQPSRKVWGTERVFFKEYFTM